MILFSIFIGKILEKVNNLNIFIIGIFLNFIYIFYIVIMKEKIISNLNILAILYSSSCMFYNLPKNLFWSKIIDNDKRLKWTTNNKIIGAILSVVVPIVLGFSISKYNYISIGLFLLILCFLEIMISLFLKFENNVKYKLDLKDMYNKLTENLKKILFVEFLLGLTIVNGALNIIVTILTILNFKTDVNLDFINSLIAFISIIFIFIYSKIRNNKNEKSLILISFIISTLFILLYLFFPSSITLVLYNISYTIFFSFIAMIQEIKLLNNLNKTVKESNKNSFIVLREIFLNFGKVVSFILLCIISLINIRYLKIIAFLLSLTIFLAGFIIIQIEQK